MCSSDLFPSHDKSKSAPAGVLEWWLGLKECLDGWGCFQLMGDEVVVGHYQGAALKPLVLILDDDGHAFLGVVNLGHKWVGFGGDDGVGA